MEKILKLFYGIIMTDKIKPSPEHYAVAAKDLPKGKPLQLEDIKWIKQQSN